MVMMHNAMTCLCIYDFKSNSTDAEKGGFLRKYSMTEFVSSAEKIHFGRFANCVSLNDVTFYLFRILIFDNFERFERKQDFVILSEFGFLETFVGSKKLVHKSIGSEVSIESVVVVVMEFGAVKERQVQATVFEVCRDDDEQVEDECGRHVGSENQKAANGKNIAKQVFKGVTILSCKGDRGDPLVMDLVYVLVKHFVMQQPVIAIENHFIDRGTSNHVDHQLPE